MSLYIILKGKFKEKPEKSLLKKKENFIFDNS